MTIKVQRWEGLPTKKLSDYVSRRGLHGENLTVAQFIMKKGYILPNHSHPNEQMTWVLKGALRLDFATGESITLREGDFVIVPANLEHSGEVLEDCLDFDAFAPVRSDWLDEPDETYYTTGNK